MEDASQVSSKGLLSLFKRKFFLIIAVVIGIILIAISLYFYNQYQKTKSLLANPAQTAQDEADVKKITAEIGNLMLLPQDEEPTMARVSNKDELPEDAFFQKAENGDVVLLYAKAKKAILYRPSIKKIIEVSPANIGGSPTPPPVTTAPVIPSGTGTVTPSPSPSSINPLLQ